jgi:hypothetical protein
MARKRELDFKQEKIAAFLGITVYTQGAEARRLLLSNDVGEFL